MSIDVVIVGGGPAGLAAALVLGRARKHVLLCDAGPRRNAAAAHVQGFVTRDGIRPDQFRHIARQQLAAYPTVVVRDAPVDTITPHADGVTVRVMGDAIAARRVLLCTGMVDEVPRLPGFAELWGHAVVQCPYCHGWEVRDRAFGYLAPRPDAVDWPLLLRGWSEDVMVFTDGRFDVPADARRRLDAAGIVVEERPLLGLEAMPSPGEAAPRLAHVVLADGTCVPRDVLFAHPVQRQVPLVAALDLALDDRGYVRVDEHAATSTPRVHAAGDLTTGYQAATLAAASGFRAAAAINHALTVEDALASGVR